jgi:GMP synthase (glutamine-hydrolysing)
MILIIDYGSQYTQLIARRVRELGVYCEILSCHEPLPEKTKFELAGFILSGGPSSVYQEDAPKLPQGLLEKGKPVLGICYGAQLMASSLGGGVHFAKKREYGFTKIIIKDFPDLFSGFESKTNDGELKVWMSHGDKITALPKDFEQIAISDNSPYAAIRDEKRKLYGVQFHPEVSHTDHGSDIISNFIFKICQGKKNWDIGSFVKKTVEDLKKQIGEDKVVLGLSGGVDSTVVAALLSRAAKEKIYAIFVDNGLLRKNEFEEVLAAYKAFLNIHIIPVDAKANFLNELKGITDPEQKRKIIGRVFIEVFEEQAKKIEGVKYLAQGTLYPDLIESRSFRGPSATIKSHHNVGGLPEKMNLSLIEPLKELFKDEVRKVGAELGVPEKILKRHPFPGPGLAVRIISDITEEKLSILKEADAIAIEELKNAGLYDKIWQAFTVLLPVKSVGVMGDERTYENTIVLRAVESSDGMTADWAKIPNEVLERISSRIINEVKGVNRVVYDISSKPPSTIEWE